MAVRAFSIAVALAAFATGPALAQFGGMPSGPAMPQAEPHSPSPPAACQQLVADRDDTEKHGRALQAAGKKRAPPEEVCMLFKAFLAAESKLLRNLEDNSARCGIPTGTIEAVRAGHDKASKIGEQVCEVAGGRTRPLRVLERAPERPCEALWARLSCPLEGEN